MRHSFAEINVPNFCKNFINIRKKVKPAKVMAVVKADAYGHGAVECAKALAELGNDRPDYLAVALIEEGIELRKAKIDLPILSFAPFCADDINDYIKYNIETTIFSEEHLKEISDSGKKIKAHVKVDTGMGRLGIRYNDAYDFIKRAYEIKNIVIAGTYTHFATADEQDKSFAIVQLERFKNIIDKLKTQNINYGLAHTANSGAILDMPDSYFDMVRPGIILYGYYPSKETSESIKIYPVMSVVSIVESVKQIFRGESVSYGRKHTAKRTETVAAVSFGYADGYMRGLTNKACGIIGGELYRQIGSVCMDKIMFDVSEGNIKPQDKIILLGSSKNVKFDADDWADLLDTIPYEILCGISKRVPRTYIK